VTAPPLDRREFCALLAVSLAAACARRPAPSADPRADLVAALDLRDGESAWLDVLAPDEQRALRDDLFRGDAGARSAELLMRVLGRRDRLFAYVGYPVLPDRLTACDGLLRE
jgi:hypothetical protein